MRPLACQVLSTSVTLSQGCRHVKGEAGITAATSSSFSIKQMQGESCASYFGCLDP
jgi:hypothetical protein